MPTCSVIMCQWRRICALLDEQGPFIYAVTRTTMRSLDLASLLGVTLNRPASPLAERVHPAQHLVAPERVRDLRQVGRLPGPG